MTDADALLRAVLLTPADVLPRLVLADFLEESGEPSAVARAEWIRLSCEIAAGGDESQAFASKREARARELWTAWGHEWREPFFSPIEGDMRVFRDKPAAKWRRGFIEEITVTLDTFLGGRCGACDGRGRVYIGQVRRFDPDERAMADCLFCSGSGRIVGAVSLFAKWPIFSVVFTNFYPTPSSGDYWILEGLGEASGRDHDPRMWGELEELVWDSAEDAAKALSHRAVEWGRKLAGLEPFRIMETARRPGSSTTPPRRDGRGGV